MSKSVSISKPWATNKASTCLVWTLANNKQYVTFDTFAEISTAKALVLERKKDFDIIPTIEQNGGYSNFVTLDTVFDYMYNSLHLPEDLVRSGMKQLGYIQQVVAVAAAAEEEEAISPHRKRDREDAEVDQEVIEVEPSTPPRSAAEDHFPPRVQKLLNTLRENLLVQAIMYKMDTAEWQAELTKKINFEKHKFEQEERDRLKQANRKLVWDELMAKETVQVTVEARTERHNLVIEQNRMHAARNKFIVQKCHDQI